MRSGLRHCLHHVNTECFPWLYLDANIPYSNAMTSFHNTSQCANFGVYFDYDNVCFFCMTNHVYTLAFIILVALYSLLC